MKNIWVIRYQERSLPFSKLYFKIILSTIEAKQTSPDLQVIDLSVEGIYSLPVLFCEFHDHFCTSGFASQLVTYKYWIINEVRGRWEDEYIQKELPKLFTCNFFNKESSAPLLIFSWKCSFVLMLFLLISLSIFILERLSVPFHSVPTQVFQQYS